MRTIATIAVLALLIATCSCADVASTGDADDMPDISDMDDTDDTDDADDTDDTDDADDTDDTDDQTDGDTTGQFSTEAAVINEAFAPYAKVATDSDDDYFYAISDGLAEHEMMVGITAWIAQVPIPQAYRTDSKWAIPLNPQYADSPVSLTGNFQRGAVAIAVNGIPIFNPVNASGDISGEKEPPDRCHECHIATSDRSRPRAAVRLQHIAVDRDRDVGNVTHRDDGSQASPDEPLDL